MAREKLSLGNPTKPRFSSRVRGFFRNKRNGSQFEAPFSESFETFRPFTNFGEASQFSRTTESKFAEFRFFNRFFFPFREAGNDLKTFVKRHPAAFVFGFVTIFFAGFAFAAYASEAPKTPLFPSAQVLMLPNDLSESGREARP